MINSCNYHFRVIRHANKLPPTCASILFMFIEMKIIHLSFLCDVCNEVHNICNDLVNYDEKIL